MLAAASRRQLSLEDGKVEGSEKGGGAVSLVPAGSTHETFTDALVLFAGKTTWLLKMVCPIPLMMPSDHLSHIPVGVCAECMSLSIKAGGR